MPPISPQSDYRPRLATELTPEQHSRLLQILPHGMQKPLFQVIVAGVLELYDRGGMSAIGAIISEYIGVNQIVSSGLDRTRNQKILDLEKKLKELRGTL